MRHLPALLLWGSLLSAQTLQESIEAVLSAAPARAVWGIHVVDLDTGDALAAINPAQPLTPASNTKLFTTALALLRLGPEHRWQTTVRANARIDADGTLASDLILLGSGDPAFSHIETLAARLSTLGLRRITGDVVGDDTLFPWTPYPDGWTVDDTLYDYGAPVSALTLDDNTIVIRLRPGDSPTILTEPSLAYYTFLNSARLGAGEENSLRLDRLPGSRVIEVSGAIPESGAALRVAVDDPALFAARALAAALSKFGVTIDGRPRARHRPAIDPPQVHNETVLLEQPSDPLPDILSTINKKSHNLQAELVLREVARVAQNDGSLEAALLELDRFLPQLQIPPDEVHFEDGSGLSRKTLLSPRAITSLLSFMNTGPNAGVFLSTLPIGNQDGSLQNRFAGLSGATSIRAKTGSIRHVAALSGYILQSERRRLVFSIIANHATARPSELRETIDRIVETILQQVSP